MSDLLDLAEALLAEHPFDAGKAMTEAIRADLGDVRPAFRWAEEHIAPHSRAMALHGHLAAGKPPWMLPAGTGWTNFRRSGQGDYRDRNGWWEEYRHRARRG